MSSISVLIIILFALMTIVGGKQGMVSFFSVALNFFILFITVILISGGFPILGVSLFAGICILAITIYMGNNDERSTNVAFIATVIVMLIMIILIIPFDHMVQIQGFSNEESEEVEAFNLLIGINFESLAIATTILSTLGAIAEASIAVASGLEELIAQNSDITVTQLYKSGRNIGFQIMGMTFNTLFFGMFGGNLALFILLYKLHASFGYYLNSKIFVGESMSVLYSAIAVILVIWITTYLMGRKLNSLQETTADLNKQDKRDL
ncbi:YibE/F family protein [Ligilactobacillus sp. WILCCON 0076]|uniref:YibE/F family protein n=1 Tax=Ligilactobacillus ubinensis TaxID=2876789 RepID=A0A9X2FKI4_9LACO|nr:YibE/F family protein [Ligilactobacillus ubinensis]MCP0887291.1 YibE/F family protein [Ligilactobacillus ubinensis]